MGDGVAYLCIIILWSSPVKPGEGDPDPRDGAFAGNGKDQSPGAVFMRVRILPPSAGLCTAPRL